MSHSWKQARDPISSWSHFIGAVVFAAATVLLLVKTLVWSQWSVKILLGLILFGCSLVALYTASSVYHWFNGSVKTLVVLRKLDHAMIYVLIAGTYTPILLKYLPSLEGAVFTAAIWGCALLGIVIKLCWFSAPRWLQTMLYLAMGWAILFDLSIFQAMSGPAVVLLAAGGISYTVGGIIYMLKRPNLCRSFGFHELFHIFVLLGSAFHFLMIFFYVS